MSNSFQDKDSKDIYREKQSNNLKEIKEWLQVIAIAIILAFLIRTFLLEIVVVVGESMEPTLYSHDRVIVWKLGYITNEPEYGDIIVFQTPEDPKINYVKRIIGLPGDKVAIASGTVYLNDEQLDEPYINELTIHDFDEIIVPQDTFFALGDNRNYSKDSRDPHVGFVPMDNLLGQAIIRIWPLSEISILK